MSTPGRFNLAGRAALVTGASRGIGRAIALALAEAGADVAIHCVRRRADAEAVAGEAARQDVRTAVIAADLNGGDAARQIRDEAVHALGRVDILVSNASVQIRKPWPDITREEFDRQVTVNWRAAWELIQLLLPGMIERRWGRVVTIGSVQQNVPHPEMLIYGAAKAAQHHMVRNLARVVGPHGVTVNNLAPGVIETERNAAALADPDRCESVRAKIPSGIFGQPEDCVGAALLLCSDAGCYMTGANIVVDGGLSI
jgi:NAD(P)-dependent dehydrogenase (short-subunit alcohol dehydrogenase family)